MLGSRLFVILNRLPDLPSMSFDEFGRKCVSNHQRECLFARRRIEFVTPWKALKDCRFSHGDAPITARV